MKKDKDDNSLLRNYETKFNEIISLKYKEQTTCQNRILYSVKMSLKNEDEMKPLSDNQKLREFSTAGIHSKQC